MVDDTKPRDEEGAPAVVGSASSPESADSAAPSSAAPQPQGVDSLDALLAEYDQGIKQQPEQPQQPEQTEPQLDPLADHRLDSALSAVDREIEAKARGFYEQEAQKAELARAFEGHVAGIQAKCPDHCPEGYARDALVAMAASDHRLEVAFRAAAQGVNRGQVMADLDRVNFALQHAARNPTADPRTIPQLQQMAWQLSVAFHAHTILRQAEHEIVRRAGSRAPIDETVTGDVALVAASMKGASRPVQADPPPAFGRMDDQSFRRFTRENYGF
jgi:hypothetical protein